MSEKLPITLCDNCRFAVRYQPDELGPRVSCHRHAPQGYMGTWPIVYSDGNGCGDGDPGVWPVEPRVT